jgi:TRAP-type C4-dicarboxylate transport system permease small subunit
MSAVGLVRRLDVVAAAVSRFAATLTGVTLVALTVLVAADVVSRQLGNSIAGSFEVAELLMAVVVYLPLAFVQRQREHVAVTMATRRLPPRGQEALDALGCLVGLVVVLLLFKWTLDHAINATALAEHRIGMVRVPVWPFRWALPLGFALFAIELLISLIKHTVASATGRGLEPVEETALV